MSERHDDQDLLDRLVREARDEARPELDWDGMEQRLMQRLDSEAPASAHPSPKWRWALAVAAAALVALGAGKLLQRDDSGSVAWTDPAAAPRLHTESSVDGRRLTRGDEIRAGSVPTVVTHAGHAKWTLSPGGTAAVAESGKIITLKLGHGAIDAEVVPSTMPETFAIEVEETRVAVHGTRFHVERGPDGVVVEVSEGVVGVGPVSDRGQPRWWLRKGDSGSFRPDGRLGEVKRGDAVPAETEQPATPARPTVRLPLQADAKELQRALEALSRSATECFASSTIAEGQVRIQVETVMSVRVAPDGSVGSVSFEPPLAPAVVQCVQAASKKQRLSPSERGATASHSLLLGS